MNKPIVESEVAEEMNEKEMEVGTVEEEMAKENFHTLLRSHQMQEQLIAAGTSTEEIEALSKEYPEFFKSLWNMTVKHGVKVAALFSLFTAVGCQAGQSPNFPPTSITIEEKSTVRIEPIELEEAAPEGAIDYESVQRFPADTVKVELEKITTSNDPINSKKPHLDGRAQKENGYYQVTDVDAGLYRAWYTEETGASHFFTVEVKYDGILYMTPESQIMITITSGAQEPSSRK